LSGYFGNTLNYCATQTSALASASFVLQLQPGVIDNISVQFDNFHFCAGCSGGGDERGATMLGVIRSFMVTYV
jgi:hypothetical protein